MGSFYMQLFFSTSASELVLYVCGIYQGILLVDDVIDLMLPVFHFLEPRFPLVNKP